jgi:mitochondrial ornithine carrier protein
MEEGGCTWAVPGEQLRWAGCLQLVRTQQLSVYYQGLPAPIVGAMAENASMFLAYNELQNAIRLSTGKLLHQSLSLGELSIAAAGAGAITSFFLCVPYVPIS